MWQKKTGQCRNGFNKVIENLVWETCCSPAIISSDPDCGLIKNKLIIELFQLNYLAPTL